VRLFIAVNLPDEMRNKIWEATVPLREDGDSIRWVASEGMHLTLKFLGDVTADREDAVGRALERSASGVTPFVLRLGGFGAFPNVRRAKVIWVGCEAPSPLQLLHRQVEGEMGEIGFEQEARSFHPHLTLGRVRRQADSKHVRGVVSIFERLNFTGEVPVCSVELMQSELTPAGANYTKRKSVELTQ
jgi:2'-5' RNA ligase